MFKQKQISLQAQDQQLGYDILGRLFSAAENYYLKCQGKTYNYQTTYYSSYDTFNNANKKSKEAVRRELINQINIFQASNQYFQTKYKFGLQPPNIQQAINDVNLWKQSMKNKKDIELYDGILKILNNNQINTDNFSNEEKEDKNKKLGRQEFWSNIGSHASSATQQRIESINNIENFQPTFQRGSGHNPYLNNNLEQVDEAIKLSDEANIIIKDLDNLFVEYYNQKISIKKIKDKYNKLLDLINKINVNSNYLFPESIVEKKNFLKNINILLNNEKKDENKAIFIGLKELFSELSYYH